MKIIFTGGGTAGHTFPILAIIREMKRLYPKEELKIGLFYAGSKNNYPFKLLKKEGIKIKHITAGKVRRYFSIRNFFDLFKIPVGFLQALFRLFLSPPDILLSTGGYASFPAVLAAKMLFIPIFLHESDACPGLASKITSRWSLETFTSFQQTEYFAKEKMIFTGNPVRTEVIKGDKEQAKLLFNLEDKKPLLFVMGGSQGAQSINNLILEILPELLTDYELIHQTGKNNYEQVKKEADILTSERQKRRYHPVPFLNEAELRAAFAKAELVISRAGAGALFEIAANNKPSFLIPLEGSAGNHQAKNAYQYAKMGSAEVLEHENLKPHFFLEKIRYFFSRPQTLKGMIESTRQFARPKAASVIASYLVEYIKQSKKKNGKGKK